MTVFDLETAAVLLLGAASVWFLARRARRRPRPAAPSSACGSCSGCDCGPSPLSSNENEVQS